MPVPEQTLLDFIAENPGVGREGIRQQVAPAHGSTTIWRILKKLVDENKLEVTGKGRATGYHLAGSALVRNFLKTPYNRRRPVRYNREFLDRYIPNKTCYLAEAERRQLKEAGQVSLPSLPAGTYARRILERLLVDLSWASSRISLICRHLTISIKEPLASPPTCLC